ncbi:MAG: 2-oxoglutarate oxidoreductase, delta subunit, putative [Candidatus Kapaibacterium sp.]|jgi:2-oxoglutarate ferredoxin oxidoreductase subunit delta|nr:MAG: 2-oxoglutarate oxidoreductase, delta subunit, putative [Candidatus Kapabacteria bacterium]ROL57242.1 MAG: 4Fe-4S dicluster domain-containing protein [Bacteroidetes/Chlorobi group bacterium Naka2016]
MAKVVGEVVIDIERCKACELCVQACPEQTLALGKQLNHKGYQYVVKINDNCTGCANCAIICPDAVITVYRKVYKTKQQVPA